ncbi:MraY family glycosyltransferase [Imhoffiella purpurea]|uniref:Undecaprenyl-phosphate N-acetylglucosaminyl 1-phosphate transferase n=1 Tax=Imhoffiella purpurea TaxID=1249627 RepID=W9VXJ0_9GAMM|nr:MraY family glycosyltransferase [Imhoffiella purpurea]EXJ15145.1 Undecaprenyl-phosphate N-acetylglucosaminyl 1-phosphate transferase [Imhoffiella purpurea]
MTPRTGGIAIVIGTLIPVLLWAPMRADLHAYVLGAFVIFVFGILDDRLNLDYRLKLLGQVAAALIVTLVGGVLIQRVPLLGFDLLPFALSLPLTVFVLVGLTNAVNLSDGLDGLAGGLSLLALGCLSVLAYQCGDSAALMVVFAIMGATFGFLRFNTNPAQIFMGDTGSQFLGFSTGVMALIVTQRPDTAVSALVPILILGLPILDTVNVMVRRIAEGRSPFSADRLHLHHQLLALGWSQYQAVVAIYIAQAVLILLAYVFRYSADLALALIYVGFSILMLVGIEALSRRGSRADAGAESRVLDDDPDDRRLLEAIEGFLARWSSRLLSFVVPLVLVGGALAAPDVGSDIGVLTSLLLAQLLVGLWLTPRWRFWSERLAAYVIAVAVVYFLYETSMMDVHGRLVMFVFGLLGVAIALWVRFSNVDFNVSTLDILILIVAVVVPSLSASWYARFGWLALGVIILFYAIEVLMSDARGKSLWLRLSVAAALGILAIKGFLD